MIAMKDLSEMLALIDVAVNEAVHYPHATKHAWLTVKSIVLAQQQPTHKGTPRKKKIKN